MKIEGKTVLVTGGAGFIGSHLVDALGDCRVRVLDDLSTGSKENLAHHVGNARVELMQGDVRSREDVARALQGVEVVFHLACRGVRHSIGNPRENHDVNATGTLTLLQEAHRCGVQRFVHVSSSEVYGTARTLPMDENHCTYPETVYGAAKLAGECYSRAYHQTYGFPSLVIRPFNNFGPRSHYEGDSGEVIPRFIVWALNGMPPVIFGDGSQTRDFIYVEETAYWMRRLAETDEALGRTINLGSGKETSVLELAEIIYEEVLGSRMKPDFQPPRPGDVQRHLAGTQQARQLLGFHTRIPFRDGVRKVAEYLRNSPGGTKKLLDRTQKFNWTAAQESANSA